MSPKPLLEGCKMKNCERCVYFGAYKGYYRAGCKEYICSAFPAGKCDLIFVKKTCRNYKEKNMNIEEAYKVLQAEWVRINNVEVGDLVKVTRVPKQAELGSDVYYNTSKQKQVGNSYEVERFKPRYIVLNTGEGSACLYPFFCLELVKKAEPKIEIDVKINGVTSKLSDVSQETLLNIREKS